MDMVEGMSDDDLRFDRRAQEWQEALRARRRRNMRGVLIGATGLPPMGWFASHLLTDGLYHVIRRKARLDAPMPRLYS